MRFLSILLLFFLARTGTSQQEYLEKADFFVQEFEIDSALHYLSLVSNQQDPGVLYRLQMLETRKTDDQLEEWKLAIEGNIAKFENESISAMVKVIYQSYFVEQLISISSENGYAISLIGKTLSLFQGSANQDSFSLMHLLHNKGNLLYDARRYDEAILALEKALEIAEKIDTRDESMIAIICFDLANPLYSNGEYHHSYELVERSALALSSLEQPNLDYYQNVYLDLFSTSLDFGYIEKAENYLNKAEQIYLDNIEALTQGLQEKKDAREVTLLYNRMMLFSYTNNEEGSLEILSKAERRFRNHEDYYFKLRLAAIYNYMGELYVIADPKRSFKYYRKAAEIFSKKEDYAYSLMFEFNLGKAYLNSKQYGKARDLARTIITKGESIEDYRLPFFYFLLAKANLENGLFQESLESLHAIVRSMNKSDVEINLLSQEGISSFEPSENLNDGYLMVAAAQTIEMHITDSQASNLVMNSLYQLSKANFVANFKKDKFTEKSNEEYEKIMDGIISTDLYLGKESIYFAELIKFSENASSRSLWERIKFKNQQLDIVDPTLLAKEKELRSEITNLKLDAKGADSIKIKADLFEKELALEQLELEKRQKYTSFYKYEDFDFDFRAFQKNIDPSQKVLKYEILDSLLYLYEISNSDISITALDSMQNIHSRVTQFVEMVRNPSSDIGQLNALAAVLYELLIPKTEEKELLIISDGILNYLPFDILRNEEKYLIDKYTIRHATSLALLAEASQENEIKSSLIVAPSYNDYSLSNQQLAVRGAAYNLDGALAEADAIADIIGAEKLSRSEASKAQFMAKAAGFDLLHLSMHSFMNDEDPELSSLVFYDGEDENELFISELYGMNLDAKLAVLSACNTGVGKEKTGEGMVSVNHAFTYAGVQAVVSSLWSAPDKATQEIMTTFYRNLKEGLSKDEALRNAKITYRESQSVEALAHPFFWGGFVLHGSNAPLNFVGWSESVKISMVIIGTLLFLVLGFYLRKRLTA